MYFSLSSLAALALSISLATAAPTAAPKTVQRDGVLITFEGADPDASFNVVSEVGFFTNVGSFSNGNADLSISYISYDRVNYACVFTGAHDGEGAAQAALACSGNQCQLGPPQPVYTSLCSSCDGLGPYCDGYPSL